MPVKKPVVEPEIDAEKPKRQVNVGRSEDYALIYSDVVRTAVGAYDIKLTFSVNEVLPNNDILITEMVTIALTPQHAKVLAETLTRNVERYEKDIMPLKINEAWARENSKSLKSILLSE